MINTRFVKPLDEALLESVFNKEIPIVVVEDNIIAGGLGSAVLEFAARHGCSANRVKLIGAPDAFVQHDSVDRLREKIGLTASRIADTVQDVIGSNQRHPSQIH